MTVNPISETAPESSLDEDLRVLVEHLRPVLIGLKGGSPPPARFHEAFERGSLGPRHAPALLAVAFAGQASVSELAKRLGLSLSTTSLLIGELSRAGLCSRTEDESDRRRTLVQLDPAYGEEAAVWLRQRLEPFRRTLERLSPAARAGFMEGWRILAEETERIGEHTAG
jgi:DNA-binding MarR family transcriptional regulator